MNDIDKKFESYIKSLSSDKIKKLFPDYRNPTLSGFLRLPTYAKRNILFYHRVK